MKKPEQKEVSMDVVEQATASLEQLCSTFGGDAEGLKEKLVMASESFEKDDDSNGHIDFITAASVGRESVCVYGGRKKWSWSESSLN